jgi:GDP-4-dehydro-6-deoxy-D-mannose reductase
VEVHTAGRAGEATTRHHPLKDVTSTRVIADAVAAAAPDAVFHLAGLARAAEPAELYRVNVGFAVTLLAGLEEAGLPDRPVLFVGSAAEYGLVGPGDLPITEECPTRPYGHYGASKLAQTQAALSAARGGRPVVVARAFNVMGPGMPDHLVLRSVVTQLARVVRGEQPPELVLGNLEARRDFVDVGDAVRAYARLVSCPAARGEVVNVCSGRPVRIADLVERATALAGVSVTIRREEALLKAVDVPEAYGSPEKLRRLVGEAPPLDLDRSLSRILEEVGIG